MHCIFLIQQKVDEHDDEFETIESSVNDLNVSTPFAFSTNLYYSKDILAKTILENAREDLITSEDLQGTPQEVVGKIAQKVKASKIHSRD